MNLSPPMLKTLLRDMLLIRKVEERIESVYPLDEMKTPIHLCVGQEAVAVGVCANLRKDDYVSGTHRGHGHYLAKGGDLNRMIAELYCRETGCSKGRGGSMHLADPSVGHLGSSSIVGGGIPIGTGLGLAIKMKKADSVSAIFFGDGAADEGVLYESVNFAMLKKLPVLFICENNQLSVCSRVTDRHDGPLVFHSLPPNRLFTRIVDGNAVLEVYEAARLATDRARQGLGPSLVECVTYRLRGHIGAGSDVALGYRTQEEMAYWESKCPIKLFEQQLLSQGILSEAELQQIAQGVEKDIDQAFAFAQSSPLPKPEDVTKDLFRE